MKLISKLKKIFKKTKPYLDKHEVILFKDIFKFISYINETGLFDYYDIYYYKGTAEQLKVAISNIYGNGKKDINYNSIDFLACNDFHELGKKVIFSNDLFFPDKVKDFKYYIDPNWLFYYHNDTGYVKITKAVIAQDSIYFCSK